MGQRSGYCVIIHQTIQAAKQRYKMFKSFRVSKFFFNVFEQKYFLLAKAAFI